MTVGFLSGWLASLPQEWIAGVDEGVFERAYSAHQSPGRHYHTWEHVLACVEQLRSTPCDSARAVFLALVFHDAVYVAGAPDNEAQSARLARVALSATGSVDEDELAIIERMILATRNHFASAAAPSSDEAALLDIDLSILGAPRPAYAAYARAIHDEWVPAAATEAAFTIGRLEFLRGVIGAPHIYRTPSAQQRWDESARANIAWEISELTSRQGMMGRALSAVRSVLPRRGA